MLMKMLRTMFEDHQVSTNHYTQDALNSALIYKYFIYMVSNVSYWWEPGTERNETGKKGNIVWREKEGEKQGQKIENHSNVYCQICVWFYLVRGGVICRDAPSRDFSMRMQQNHSFRFLSQDIFLFIMMRLPWIFPWRIN